MANPDDTTDELTPPAIAPLAVAPAASSREVMRALADKLAITLRTQAALGEAAIGEMVASLYAGRFEVYAHAHERFRRAYTALRELMQDADKTIESAFKLDPAYMAAIESVRADIQFRATAAEARKLDSMSLALEYISHRIVCKTDSCAESQAYEAEFKRRGLAAPKVPK